MTKDNDCSLEQKFNPHHIMIWLKNMSETDEAFKCVSVVPFGDMCFIHPKDMPKDKAIAILKKYCKVYANDD